MDGMRTSVGGKYLTSENRREGRDPPLSGCLCLGSCVHPGRIRDNLVKTKVKRAKGSWLELEHPRAHEALQGILYLFLYILASPQSYLLYVVSF